jgi:hypothetical protein
MVQDESAGQGQPEQPVAQGSEPTTAVAVKDAPAAEPTPEFAVVAEGPENSMTESVMKSQTPDTEPVDTGLVSDPAGAVKDASIATQEPASDAATIVSEGAGVPDTVPVAEESASPKDTPAEEAPVSEQEGTEPTETDVRVLSETVVAEGPTGVESESLASQQAEESVLSEAEHPENSQASALGTPPMPVEKNGEREAKEKRPATDPLAVSPIPVRSAFLPVQSAQNRSGYTLRGLF